VKSELYEDREPIWPGGPNVEAYPWRVDAEPLIVLEEQQFVPAIELVGDLEHAAKWPAEHWQLAFQGQLRIVSEHDARLLIARLEAAAGVPA
jgi:predicted RNA-binding protein